MKMPIELEFLHLAALYIACRWRVMGHEISDFPKPNYWPDALLGMHDAELEMSLLLR